jgi:tetratricopeptide (TPR) repeat protein
MRRRSSRIWLLIALLGGGSLHVLAQNPNKALLEGGIASFKEGKYSEAVDVFKDVLRKSFDQAERIQAHVYLAYTYFYEREIDPKNLNLAKAQIEKAIETNPDFAVGPPEFIQEFASLYKQIKETLVGIVTIDAIPSPAKVFLDDAPAGTTPQIRELLANQYVLRLVRSGYAPREVLLDIKKMEAINVKINLNDERNWKTFLRSGLVFVVVAVLAKTL